MWKDRLKKSLCFGRKWSKLCVRTWSYVQQTLFFADSFKFRKINSITCTEAHFQMHINTTEYRIHSCISLLKSNLMKQLVNNPFLPGRALRSGSDCDKMMRVKLISANSTQWNTPPVLLTPLGNDLFVPQVSLLTQPDESFLLHLTLPILGLTTCSKSHQNGRWTSHK